MAEELGVEPSFHVHILDDKEVLESLANSLGLTTNEMIFVEKAHALANKKTIAEYAQAILLEDAELDKLKVEKHKKYGGIEVAQGTFIGLTYQLKQQDSYKVFQSELYALVAQGKITKETADFNFAALRATAVVTGNLN